MRLESLNGKIWQPAFEQSARLIFIATSNEASPSLGFTTIEYVFFFHEQLARCIRLTSLGIP